MSSENPSPESASPESSSGDDQRIQKVQKQVADLQAALQSTKQTRNLLVLTLLSVLVIAGVLFYRLGQRLQDAAYQEALGAAAQAYLDQNTPEYMKEVQMLVDNVGPKLSDAFMEQVKTDTPHYAKALDRQRELLMENLENRMALALNDHYEKTLEEYESIIVEEFPAADDDKTRRRVMANFRVALNEMVEEFYIDEFRTELTALNDTWDGFPIVSSPDKGDLPVEDQLFGTLLNVLSLKISSSGVDVAADYDPAAEAAGGQSTVTPDETPESDTAPAPADSETTPRADTAPANTDDTPDKPASEPNDDAKPEPSESDASASGDSDESSTS